MELQLKLGSIPWLELFDNALFVLYKYVNLSTRFFSSFFNLSSTLPRLSNTQLLNHPACFTVLIYLDKGYNFFFQRKQCRFVLLFTANSRVNSSSDPLIAEAVKEELYNRNVRKQLHSLQVRIDRAKPVSCRYFQVKRPPLSLSSARFCVVNYKIYLLREKNGQKCFIMAQKK